MGMTIESGLNDIKFDEKLISVFKTYSKYVNFRFGYVVRTSITQLPDELNQNIDCEYKPLLVIFVYSANCSD